MNFTAQARLRWSLLGAAAVCAFAAAPARSAGLVGAQVTYDYFVNGGHSASLGTQTIADGTTFTDNSEGLRSFLLSNGYAVVQNTSPLAFANAVFNGPEFTFQPGIVSAVVDTQLTSPDFKGNLFSDNTGFAIDFHGLTPGVGSSLFAAISGPLLAGQQAYYQYGFPNSNDTFDVQGPVTLVPTTYFVDGADGILLALNKSAITVLNLEPLAFAAGVNGPDLTFSGLHIAGATIDPSSAPDFLGVVSHTSNSISINFAGLDPGVGHAFVIDVATAQGVPEPAAWSLMITGFGAAGALLRRNRVRAAA